MTNTRKEILSITFTGVTTNTRNGNTVDYLYWGNDQHTKVKLSITFTGVMTNTRKEILSITFTGVTTNIRK